MKRGKVVIIPDETQVLKDKFEKSVYDDSYHLKAYQEFIDQNKLGTKLSNSDVNNAGLIVANLGHFNYKTEDDCGIVIFYIPAHVTNRQLEYFEMNLHLYTKYKMIGAYAIKKVDQDIYKEEIYGLDNIRKYMVRKNINEKEISHVR